MAYGSRRANEGGVRCLTAAHRNARQKSFPLRVSAVQVLIRLHTRIAMASAARTLGVVAAHNLARPAATHPFMPSTAIGGAFRQQLAIRRARQRCRRLCGGRFQWRARFACPGNEAGTQRKRHHQAAQSVVQGHGRLLMQ